MVIIHVPQFSTLLVGQKKWLGKKAADAYKKIPHSISVTADFGL
jgi:hypothetical protein